MNKEYQSYVMDCRALGFAPLTFNVWAALYKGE